MVALDAIEDIRRHRISECAIMHDVAWQQLVIDILRIIFSWPVIIGLVVVLLRTPLGSALKRVTDFEGFGVKSRFGEGIQRAEDAVEQLSTPPASISPAEPAEEPIDLAEQLSTIAAISPGAAVVISWNEIEQSLGHLYRQSGNDLWPGISPYVAMSELIDQGIIPKTLGKPLNELRNLRNSVAHGLAEPNTAEALAYLQIAQNVQAILDGILALDE